jgi:hypothetical protein
LIFHDPLTRRGRPNRGEAAPASLIGRKRDVLVALSPLFDRDKLTELAILAAR